MFSLPDFESQVITKPEALREGTGLIIMVINVHDTTLTAYDRDKDKFNAEI